ncbi:MAG: T9SS type A sorting domain-containing protein [Crocinitomicaceae bacterium]
MKKILISGLILGAALFTISTTNVFSTFDLAPYHPEDPRSGGAGAILGQDRTGGPLSVGTCAACHSGGSFTPSINGQLKDEFGSTVTSYDPGEDYVLDITVTANTANNFGFQANALTSTNAQAGDFGSTLTANTQITNIGGVEYAEHAGTAGGAGSYTFSMNWIAPFSGAGVVSIYGIGMAVNGNGSTSGDTPTSGGGSGALLTINENPATIIDYNPDVLCVSDAPIFPLQSGNITGSYFSSVGLSINSTTGEVTPASSTPGIYIVDYVYGSNGVASTTIEIVEDGDASFNYSASTFCQSDANPSAIITGTGGGIFSGPTEVVFVSTSTGEIDLSASTPGGPYTITNTIGGPCGDVQTFDVTITTSEDASFVYSTDYCQTDPNPIAGSVVTPGGTFSGPGQITFLNTTTGEIDLNNSIPGGPYTITYTTSGTCSGTFTQDITIHEDYNYSTSVDICEDGTYQFGPNLLDSSDVGVHVETFTSIGGCDSTVNLTLGTTSVDTSVTLSGTTLTAVASGLTYQWVDCDNSNAPISGENNQSFTPSVDGNYAVQITDANCSKFSSCYNVIIGSSIFEPELKDLKVYPNPTTGLFEIDGIQELQNIQSIILYDLSGKEVKTFENNLTNFDINNLPKGAYQLVIEHENGLNKMKLLKD